jgi:hypothetical protein
VAATWQGVPATSSTLPGPPSPLEAASSCADLAGVMDPEFPFPTISTCPTSHLQAGRGGGWHFLWPFPAKWPPKAAVGYRELGRQGEACPTALRPAIFCPLMPQNPRYSSPKLGLERLCNGESSKCYLPLRSPDHVGVG